MGRIINYEKKQVKMWWKLWKNKIVKEDDIPEYYLNIIKKIRKKFYIKSNSL